MKTRFLSAAEAELQEVIEYYETEEPGLGAQFLNEIEAATDRILNNPSAWAPLSKRTRRCRTHRFPFGLLYQIRSDEILIVAVMDLRRDPERWEKHL